jgi:hypothetical protein
MRLRRAVLQIPTKPPVPSGLPLYKNCHSLTRLESTLLQVLIPRRFISFISNTYRKQGGGTPSSSPKVLQLVTPSPQPVNTPALRIEGSAARNPLFPSPSPSSPYIVTSLRLYVTPHCERLPPPATPFLPTTYLHFPSRRGVGVITVDHRGTANPGCLLPFFPDSTLHSQFAHSPRTSADSASLRYPFPFPVSRHSSSGQELPRQMCYRPSTTKIRKFMHALLSRHFGGAKETWQNGPYL